MAHAFHSQFELPDALILQSMGVALMAVDKDCRVARFNPLAEQLTGIASAAILGRCCHEVLKASKCTTGCPLRESLRTGKTGCSGTVLLEPPTRPAFAIEMIASALLGKAADVIGAVAILRNVAEDPGQTRVYGNRSFVSRTPAMRELFDLLPKMTTSRSPLLITGAPGTGRAALAKTVHHLAPGQGSKPLITINCQALAGRSLKEAMGHEAALQTGAGTLLLENICRATASLQRELLAWSEELESSELRLISTATEQLRQRVERGRFREDLFYRINVLEVNVPSLSERRDDIPLLVEQFIDDLNTERSTQTEGLSAGALQLLMTTTFPENVRQLRDAIAEAHAHCSGRIIDVDDLPKWVRAGAESRAPVLPWHTRMESLEKNAIENALARASGSISHAARELRMHRTTLWRKAKRYGIKA